MARHMVMQCGLNDAVGPVYVDEGDMKTLSEGLRQQIDEGWYGVGVVRGGGGGGGGCVFVRLYCCCQGVIVYQCVSQMKPHNVFETD